MCAVFMIFTAISPLVNVRIGDFAGYIQDRSPQIESAICAGQEAAHTAISEIIKQQTQAYILNKAKQLEADIFADVEMNHYDPYVPESVRISGSVSPYAKQRLKQYIAEELGISEEQQTWL